MAKRLTDTAKWKNPWFRSLPTKYKILFLYLLDECDNAGVVHLDWELFAFSLKEDFDSQVFKTLFEGKVVYLANDKIIIKRFLVWQGNHESPMMRKHIEKLMQSHGIFEDFKKNKFV